MEKRYTSILINSFLLSLIGVFVIDYFFHLSFSTPMETMPYFLTKMVLYFFFSAAFLTTVHLEEKEFFKVALAGIVVSLLWGAYYNVFPLVFDYYPFGISLEGLTFEGMGFFGTGLAFGIVHTLAFIGGYYSAVWLTERLIKNS